MKNILLLFATISLFYACKSNDTTTPNRPPNAFSVTPTLKSDGKTITLNWTKAKDPDGDAVTYTVILKDTLVKNWTDTTYTLSSLDYNYSQAGKVIAKDPKGLTTEANFTATTKTIVYVSIPDPVFEKYLVDNKIDKDGVINGKMNAEDAKGVTIIDLSSCWSVKDLTGIEAFVDLNVLKCGVNSIGGGDFSIACSALLTKLDVSKCLKLTYLDCSQNPITSLDVSKNIALTTLNCQQCKLTSLDVSKNVALQNLRCYNNQLTNLDVSQSVALQSLACSGNKLTTLNIGKSTNLTYVSCENNQLTNLDVSKNIALTTLNCNNNQLMILDLSNNLSLVSLYCSNNKLSSLDICKNENLIDLECNNNQITSILMSYGPNGRYWHELQKDDTTSITKCN